MVMMALATYQAIDPMIPQCFPQSSLTGIFAAIWDMTA